MHKRRKYVVLALALAVGAVVIAIGLFPWGEPFYKGRPLRTWTMRYSESLAWGNTFPDREAEEAIRHFGSNAIPHLINWIRYEPPAWKASWLGLVNTVFRSALCDREQVRADCAAQAIKALGSGAEMAIPALAALMNESATPNARNRAVRILLDLADTRITAGIALMTNNDITVRVGTIDLIASFKGDISQAMPVLIQCLNETNGDVSLSAAIVLSERALEPRLVVPRLIETLRRGRPQFRQSVTDALSNFGAEARLAVPALLALLGDPDPTLRDAVTNALRQIDPKALEQALNRASGKNAE